MSYKLGQYIDFFAYNYTSGKEELYNAQIVGIYPGGIDVDGDNLPNISIDIITQKLLDTIEKTGSIQTIPNIIGKKVHFVFLYKIINSNNIRSNIPDFEYL